MYGISLSSDNPPGLERQTRDGDAALEIQTEATSFFARAIRGVSFHKGLPYCYRYARLEDSSSHVRWKKRGAAGLRVYPGPTRIKLFRAWSETCPRCATRSPGTLPISMR